MAGGVRDSVGSVTVQGMSVGAMRDASLFRLV